MSKALSLAETQLLLVKRRELIRKGMNRSQMKHRSLRLFLDKTEITEDTNVDELLQMKSLRLNSVETIEENAEQMIASPDY